jgi:hypothetical protein
MNTAQGYWRLLIVANVIALPLPITVLCFQQSKSLCVVSLSVLNGDKEAATN